MNHKNERSPRYGLRIQTGLKAGDWQDNLNSAGQVSTDAAKGIASSTASALQKTGSMAWNALPDQLTWPW